MFRVADDKHENNKATLHPSNRDENCRNRRKHVDTTMATIASTVPKQS